jgi:hypothetical protein
MLQDVGEAAGIDGGGAEGDGEDFVRVIVFQGHDPRAGFVVAVNGDFGFDVLNEFGLDLGVVFHAVSFDGGIH